MATFVLAFLGLTIVCSLLWHNRLPPSDREQGVRGHDDGVVEREGTRSQPANRV